MKFRFSPYVTLTCLVLAGLMARLSLWQADRHTSKIAEIKTLEERLKLPPQPLTDFTENPATDWNSLVHRRLTLTCRYDYENEIILRNRRYEDKPGAFVITPCHIQGSNRSVLVNRGFVSYAFMDHEERKRLNRPEQMSLTGLVKADMERKMFSPSDPETGPGHPRVDAWLRITTEQIQKQLPYPIIPIYLEIIPDDAPLIVDQRLVQSQSGREEMFMLSAGVDQKVTGRETVLDPRYPIPVFDTIIPPGRHLGYIYEWAFLASLTIAVGILLQIQRTVKVSVPGSESPRDS